MVNVIGVEDSNVVHRPAVPTCQPILREVPTDAVLRKLRLILAALAIASANLRESHYSNVRVNVGGSGLPVYFFASDSTDASDHRPLAKAYA